MCLYNGIWLKDNICEKYKLQFPWDIHGVPEIISVDNGLEFHSDSFINSCHHLGITIQYRQPCTPRYGGIIERYFGSVDTQLFRLLPGKTFSNFKEKGEYQSEKKATLTLGELKYILSKFIVETYMQKFHEGIKTTPYQKWQDGLKLQVPRVLKNLDTLKLFLMREVKRIIRRDGIHFEGLEYWRPSLADHIRDIISFRYDPQCLNCIYIEDPKSKKFYEVPAKPEFKELAQSSIWEIRRINKFRYETGQKAVPENMLIIKDDLRKEIEKISTKNKKARKIKERIMDHDKNKLQISDSQQNVVDKTNSPDVSPDNKYAKLEELEKFESEVNYYEQKKIQSQ